MAPFSVSDAATTIKIVNLVWHGNTWPKSTSDIVPGWHIQLEWGSSTGSFCGVHWIPYPEGKNILPSGSEGMVIVHNLPVPNFHPPVAEWTPLSPSKRSNILWLTGLQGQRPRIDNPISCTVLIRIPAVPLVVCDAETGIARGIVQMAHEEIVLGATRNLQISVFSRRRSGSVCVPKKLFGRRECLTGKSPELDLLFRNSDFLAHEICPPSVDAEIYGYDSDSDLENSEEDDDVESVGNEEQKPPATGIAVDGLGSTAEIAPSSAQTHVPPNIDRSIVVRDSAYATWHALIVYLLTDTLKFAPLNSSGRQERKRFNAEYLERIPNAPGPIPCSPKSMFRLADKYGLSELEDRSLDALKSSLTPENIVQEYFSTFTFTYEKVQKIEFEYLREHLFDAKVKEAWHRITPTLLSNPKMAIFCHTTGTKLIFGSA